MAESLGERATKDQITVALDALVAQVEARVRNTIAHNVRNMDEGVVRFMGHRVTSVDLLADMIQDGGL